MRAPRLEVLEYVLREKVDDVDEWVRRGDTLLRRRTARREQGTDAAVLRWKRNQKSLREHSPNICEMSRSLVASMGSFDLTGTRLALLIGGA